MKLIRVSIGDGINYVEEDFKVSTCDDVDALIDKLIEEVVDENWGQNILVLQSEQEVSAIDSTI